VITRVTEVDGGYLVAIHGGDALLAPTLTVATLAEAFALQAHAQANGEFPAAPKHETEVTAKKKGRK
jgi:hypothetical protein